LSYLEASIWNKEIEIKNKIEFIRKTFTFQVPRVVMKILSLRFLAVTGVIYGYRSRETKFFSKAWTTNFFHPKCSNVFTITINA